MTLRMIQVGLGGWGRSWYEHVLYRNPEIKMVAYVDMVASVREFAQQHLKLPERRVFASLEEALAHVTCDAVLITASLPGHTSIAMAALQAGKHVLLEKPFTSTLGEAQQIINAAKQAGQIVMISQNYRYYPAVQAVRDLIRKHELGAVGNVSIDFRRYANTTPRDTTPHYHIWQPLLVDMSIHHFDLIRAVLGQEATAISCHSWNPSWSLYVEPPTATATVMLEQGAVISYRGSWVSTGPQTNWAGEWHIECAKGEIIWSSRGDIPDYVKIRLLGQRRAESITLPEVPFLDRKGSLHAFVAAVRTGQQPESNGPDNFNTLALTLASVTSSQQAGALITPERYATEK